MNENDFKTILKELYAIDPELKPREKEIIAILRTLSLKPRASYDAAFSAELRTRLLAELSNSNAASKRRIPFFTRNMRYSVVSLLALALIGTVAIVTAVRQTGNNGGNPIAINSSNVAITHVGSNAFGTLDALVAPSASQTAAGQSAQQKTGTTLAPATANSIASPMSAAALPMIPVRGIYTGGTSYDYTGGPFSQNKSQLDVLKKVSASLSADQATTALAQAGFGQVDLSTFGNLSMSNVTLLQNQSFGYQIYIDLANGTVSIYENYNKWPQETLAPLTSSNIPSDAAVIAIANQFLKDHNISKATYGTPRVSDNRGPIAIPMSSGAAGAATLAPVRPMPWYSDTENVLYPLLINGMNVYDTGGNIIGLTIEVNVRYNRVANVYGLNAQNYQASAYDAITDTDTILSIAENSNGGISYPIIYNGAADAEGGSSGGASGTAIGVPFRGITLHLGTPSMAYVQAYQSGNNGENNEFLVPAFVFPVTGNGSSANQNVVVPLIQDFVQKNPPVRIMPYTGSTVTPPTPAQPPSAQ